MVRTRWWGVVRAFFPAMRDAGDGVEGVVGEVLLLLVVLWNRLGCGTGTAAIDRTAGRAAAREPVTGRSARGNIAQLSMKSGNADTEIQELGMEISDTDTQSKGLA